MDYGITVALLRQVPIFANMEAGALKLLAFSSTVLAVEDGEVICNEGDPADGVYVIDQGRVEIAVERGGVRTRVAVVDRHEVVGEIAVILNQPRTATIQAMGPVRVVKIDADIFLRTVTANPEAALGVLRTLCERLSSMLLRFEELASRQGNTI